MKGKVVCITGAASGIGAATAKLFAREGAIVFLSDINVDQGEAVLAEIKSLGGEGSFYPCNVAVFEEVEALLQQVKAQFGKLDVMINNAGIGTKELARTADHSNDDWDRVIGVNQTGVFYCMKLALQIMMEQGHGNIVNVASLAGLKASGKNLAYSASKYAVVGMTKSAALEYGNKNIRINAVCPSYTHTALVAGLTQLDPKLSETLKYLTPMKRFGEANEIAEGILWLASDKSSYVTGTTLTLDGGMSL